MRSSICHRSQVSDYLWERCMDELASTWGFDIIVGCTISGLETVYSTSHHWNTQNSGVKRSWYDTQFLLIRDLFDSCKYWKVNISMMGNDNFSDPEYFNCKSSNFTPTMCLLLTSIWTNRLVIFQDLSWYSEAFPKKWAFEIHTWFYWTDDQF